MAININKTPESFQYYFSIDGDQFGPFTVTELLVKIDRNTLVWREGLQWTNAFDVEELRNFFPEPTKSFSSIDIKQNNNQSNLDLHSQQNMFVRPFSFDGRIGRTEYGISFMIYIIIYYITIGMSNASSFLGLIFIPLLWFLWAQGAKRCHDRGNSGWYQLIPFYFFWMLFAEGEKTANEFHN
jgi:hypothetical protein